MCLATQSCPTLCRPMDCSPPSASVHGDSLGKNTAVGSHAFLQRIFSTQGLNPGLLYFRQILYHLSYQGSPLLNSREFDFRALVIGLHFSSEPLNSIFLEFVINISSEGSMSTSQILSFIFPSLLLLFLSLSPNQKGGNEVNL